MGNCLGQPSNTDPILFTDEENIQNVVMGQSQPLLQEKFVWKSETPLTAGQLQGKRDTFWETSPLYDGRREIWDALKAAIEAAEEEDYDLAQAILTGANISLPNGSLTHAYDELGNHYSIPPYCLSRPTNFVSNSITTDSTTTDVRMNEIISKGGNPINVKIRLSNQSKDIKLTISSTDTVIIVKKRLEEEYNVKSDKITMLFSGKILTDSTILGQLDIPKGFIIQAIVR